MVDPLDRFLRLIYPWDQEHKDFFKTVMWSFPLPDKPAEKGKANYAAQDFDGLKRLIANRMKKQQFDLWISLGMQKHADATKHTYDGFSRAIRTIKNTQSLKSIWLDVDVKPESYKTYEDAAAAFAKFFKQSGMPRPTMIVKSGGGGFHVYWCTHEPMTVPAWEQLAINLRDTAQAMGLIIDGGVTIDAARVLRIPGTYNWKYDPPGLVQLVEPPDELYPLYTYQELAAVLQVQASAVAGMRVASTGIHTRTGINQNLMAGVSAQAKPVPLADIAAVCPQVAKSLTTGGVGDPEPLWNSLVLLSTFTDDPRPDAHRLSSGDPRYTQAETDKKFDEKEAAKAQDSNIGWPSCATILQGDHTNSPCKTCPLLTQGKSPLNFVAKPVSPPTSAAQQQLFPYPYYPDGNKHVFVDVAQKDDQARAIDIFGYPILDGAVDQATGALVIKTRIGGPAGHERWGSVSGNSHSSGATIIGQLADIGIHVQGYNTKLVKEFVVSWLTHLQTQKRYISASTFGWAPGEKDFRFGDALYTETGKQSVYVGKIHDDKFREEGTLAPWQAAMDLVYGNAPLEVTVASAFAAPLLNLFTDDSAILSVYSAASGVGKSTVLKLAQAVWGNPRTGMSALDDTENSVKKKVADLRSLPIYWDELITVDAVQKVVDIVFSFTGGKGKARLTRDSTQQDVSSYTTMFCIASNHGIAGGVYAGTHGTEAGGLRIFETEISSPPRLMSASLANRHKLNLNTNYGCAGAEFIGWVVRQPQVIKQVIGHIEAVFDSKYQYSSKERFWRVTMIAIYAGALLANRFDLTRFNLEAIMQCLDQSFQVQRARLKSKEDDTLSSSGSAGALLGIMIAENRATGVLVTDVVPPMGRRGQPVVVTVQNVDMAAKLGEVWIQVGNADGRIRIRYRNFQTWLYKNGQNVDHVIDKLRQEYYVNIDRAAIGAGTKLDLVLGDRGKCVDLTPISSGSNPGSP